MSGVTRVQACVEFRSIVSLGSISVSARIATLLTPLLLVIGCAEASEVGREPVPSSSEVGAIEISGDVAGDSLTSDDDASGQPDFSAGGAVPDPANPDPMLPDDPDASTESEAARTISLTPPGCCTGISWSEDSQRVHYIDKPSDAEPLGIWSVDASAPLAPPALVTEEIAYYSDDLTYRFDLTATETSIVRVSDGERWTVPAGGRPVSISPDGSRIAWQISPDLPFERRTTTAWVANLDGTEARSVATLPRGSINGWLDDETLLVRGRDTLQSEEDVLWRLDVADGERQELARAERLRGELASPGGQWVAYYVSRQTDPSANGTWIVSGSGGEARRMDQELFGAYRWRDVDHLLVVPLNAGEASHALIEVDVSTFDSRPLTEPSITPFKIANGEWTVSPDGLRVAFVESADKSIRVIELPSSGD